MNKLKTITLLNLTYNFRHWVFATEEGQWVTQREEPRMALITISLHGNYIHFDAPGMPTLKLPKDMKMSQGSIKKVQ